MLLTRFDKKPRQVFLPSSQLLIKESPPSLTHKSLAETLVKPLEFNFKRCYFLFHHLEKTSFLSVLAFSLDCKAVVKFHCLSTACNNPCEQSTAKNHCHSSAWLQLLKMSLTSD